MSDITMCTGTNCPVRSTCCIYNSKPDEMQSYSDFTVNCNLEKGFGYYIGLKIKEEVTL